MATKRPGAYVPLSVHYADDEAIMEAGEDAELMFVRMMAYAGRTPNTEGYVSRRVCLTRLGIAERPEMGPETAPEKRLERLLEVGLIQARDGGYQLVSWLRWNRSVEEMGRERDKDRQRKTPVTRGAPETTPEKVPETTPETGRKSVEIRRADTETDTETDTPLPSGVGPRKRGHRLPDDWMPDRALVDEMQRECPQVNLRAEHAKFSDFWHSKAGKDASKVDWRLVWRNWMRKASEQGGARPANRRQQQTDDQFDRAMARALAAEEALS